LCFVYVVMATLKNIYSALTVIIYSQSEQYLIFICCLVSEGPRVNRLKSRSTRRGGGRNLRLLDPALLKGEFISLVQNFF